MPIGDEHTSSPSLSEELASVLPEGHAFTFYHISTPPTRCAPLYSPPQGAKPERTYCETQFLNVSIKPADGDDELLIYAVEIFIYSTRRSTTIFVSKADSTGYLSSLRLSKSHTSPLRSITTTFLSWLVRHRQRAGKKLVLSLFARAQDQYLFPGSVENPTKHVATDRGLISWWCRVVDPVLQTYTFSQDAASRDGHESSSTAQAYLIVPGEDSTTSFLPISVRSDPVLRKRWKQGHPLYATSPYPQAPPRCLIPHFPDDPKARFVDELDAELLDNTSTSQQDSPSKRGKGMWKSVKSLDQFWEMMAFRQECSSGRLVGFLWVVFEPAVQESSQDMLESQTSTTSFVSDELETPALLKQTEGSQPKKKREKKLLTGHIIPRVPRIKKTSSNLSTFSKAVVSPYYIWPTASRGTLVLSEKDYKRVSDLLLKLDFADPEIAAVGTRQWIDEVAIYADANPWGFSVTGRKKPEPAATSTEQDGVRVLSVKRKAKIPEPAQDELNASRGEGATDLQDLGLVRKKAKIEPVEILQPSIPAVNTLGAGLIRKKPKA